MKRVSKRVRGPDGGDGQRHQGGSPPAKPGKKGSLTAEDRELWQALVQSVVPLAQLKPRVREGERSGLDAAVTRSEPILPPRQSRPAPSSSQSPADAFHRPPPAQKSPPPLAPFDRKRSRRIATGRIEIEARLDLHGARQAEAYGRFRAFILDSVARGLSTVLVVTGKGKTRAPGQPDDTWADYGFSGTERGVLRRSVPMWLEEPEMRLLVASYTAADIKHGGGGALYIHLRRRRDWR